MDERGAESISAVVTGGSNGIGAAVVRRLTEGGVRVVVVDLAEPADGVDGVRYLQGSAGDEEVLGSAVALAQGAADRFTTFVACAGISRPGSSLSYSVPDWQMLIDVDLTSVFLGARRAAQGMVGGGSIIAIASVHAHLGFGGRAAYSAAKAGVIGLARSLAIEWAPLEIRVNTISPGYIATELVERNIASGAVSEAELLSRIPSRRLGTPDEVAEAVWFLASPQSRYITGVDLLVDGGMAAFGLPLGS